MNHRAHHCDCKDYEPLPIEEGRPLFTLGVNRLGQDVIYFEGQQAIAFDPNLGVSDRRRIEQILMAVREGEGPAQGIW